jgi:folate-binding protein YgfZ
MTDATEQLITKALSLEGVHKQLGAVLREQDGWLTPMSYGDTFAEYFAVRDGDAGLFDLSTRGRIRVSGSEAVMFLNGLITNDMKTLVENHWMRAVFPNVQGRLIASVRVARLKDETHGNKTIPVFLIDTEAATHEKVFKTIERFTMAGDFHVTDITGQSVQLSVQGAKAVEILSAVLGSEIVDLPRDGVLEVDFEGNVLTAIRSTHTGEDGFDLFLSAPQGVELWESIRKMGAQPVGYDAMDVLRIEAGIARFGRDMDETNVVTETNLDDAISFTKGCYVGQEIVIRIKHRGHVAKKLTGLIFRKEEAIAPAAVIKSADAKDIGKITSATFSPQLATSIALGYVRYEYLMSGTSVTVVTENGETPATVTELPFVKGSWSQG